MKISLLVITLLIVFLTCFYLGIGFVKKNCYRGSLSDHFDGKLFHNPGVYKKKSTWDLLRWWFSRKRQKWPEHVENTVHAQISPVKSENEIRVTFVNHSTILLQTQKINFLTDPVWSKRASPFKWFGPARVRKPGVAFDALPKIDVVLISHNHYDHLDLDTLRQLDKKFHPIFLVPLGNKALLNQNGITNVVELDWWQNYPIGSSIITFLPTQHWSARWLNDRLCTLWGSYGISVANKKIYFAGDAGYTKNFSDIYQKWGKPDLAFLPIGSYQPEWFMRENHLNPEEAVKAHLDLKSRHSIGIHFGTFQLSDEGIDQPLQDLDVALKKYHLTHEEFLILKEGESKSF